MLFLISCLVFLLQIVPQIRTTCKRMKNQETKGASALGTKLVQKLASIPQFLDTVPLQITVHENKFALPTELVQGEC